MTSTTMKRQRIIITNTVIGKKKGEKFMCNRNNDDLLFNFDSNEDTDLFETAMDIAAMGLTPEDLEDRLSDYGLTREDLELIGADAMLDDFETTDDSWDD